MKQIYWDFLKFAFITLLVLVVNSLVQNVFLKKNILISTTSNPISESALTLQPKLIHNATNSCSLMPAGLVGAFPVKVDLQISNPFTHLIDDKLRESIPFLKNVKLGGSWEPPGCSARHRIAIIISYKDRADNLNTWLFNMHAYLQRQEIAYKIHVFEQLNGQPFNKGVLYNAAFTEIFLKQKSSFQCFIFHDVDLIPEGEYSLGY